MRQSSIDQYIFFFPSFIVLYLISKGRLLEAMVNFPFNPFLLFPPLPYITWVIIITTALLSLKHYLFLCNMHSLYLILTLWKYLQNRQLFMLMSIMFNAIYCWRWYNKSLHLCIHFLSQKKGYSKNLTAILKQHFKFGHWSNCVNHAWLKPFTETNLLSYWFICCFESVSCLNEWVWTAISKLSIHF